MPNTKPPYPPEFRREAVWLVESSRRSVERVASELGIAGETLRKWVKPARIDAGDREGQTS